MENQRLTAFATEAALLAYQQLMQLNLESWRPEVAEWLHSEDAEPVLKDLLVAVPCARTMH
jgi:hypothetical protein